jgi:hypothetical protein
MRPPRWDDPVGSAQEEATPVVLRGLSVRPTLYGFVGGRPVLRVQPGLAVLDAGIARTQGHLVALVRVLGLEQVLVFSQARTTDPSVGDEDVQAALATYGLTVEMAERADGVIRTAAYLVDQRIAEGEVHWAEPAPGPEGPWTTSLRWALGGEQGHRSPDLDLDLDPAGIVYGLSRGGTVVEVAPGWRRRLGTDRLARRTVRPEDRRRVRDLHRSRRTAPVEAHAGEVGR